MVARDVPQLGPVYRRVMSFWGIVVFAISMLIRPASAEAETDLRQAGLIGPVHKVETSFPVTWTVATYDRDGKLTKSFFHQDDNPGPVTYVYSHDPEGRRRMLTIYANDGSISTRSAYAYDVSGRRSADVWASEKGEFIEANFYDYDSQGYIARELTIRVNDFVTRRLYEWDMEHRQVTESLSRSSTAAYSSPREGGGTSKELSAVFSWTHTYGSKDRPKETRRYDANGAHPDTNVYTYNERGLLSERSFFRSSGRLWRREGFTYGYDSHGNWTKQTITVTLYEEPGEAITEPTRTTYRVITYH